MPETFANNAIGNLNAGINSSVNTLTLQSGQGAAFPATGNFRILVDSELMLVGARSADVFSSITRGIEGTAAAAHSNGAQVTHLITAGALGLFQQGAAGLVPIQDQVLNSAVGSITFSSIPGSYRHLQVVWDALTDNSTDVILVLQFNADGSAIYDYQYIAGTGTTSTAAQTSNSTTAQVGTLSSNTNAQARSSGFFIVQNYAGTTFRKSYTGQCFTWGNFSRILSIGGEWRSAAAITSLALSAGSGNLVIGSRFTLYGLS